MTSKPPRRTRTKKEEVYRSFTLQKPLKPKRAELKSPLGLLLDSLVFLRRFWSHFAILALVFFAFAGVLFLGFSGSFELKAASAEFQSRHGDGWGGQILTILSLLPELVEALGQKLVDSFGWFVTLNLFLSLSLWWLIRNLRVRKAGVKVRVREAIYFGPAQIVPFALLAFLIFLQFLPALVLADFASSLRGSSILQTNLEQAGGLFVVLTVFALSFYWTLGGVFALIIVSLPGSKPLDAWQTSLRITHRQRRPVFRRLAFVGAGYLLAVCLACLPFLWLVPRWAEYPFYLAGLFSFIIVHIYCFLMYQDMLEAKTAREEKDDA